MMPLTQLMGGLSIVKTILGHQGDTGQLNSLRLGYYCGESKVKEGVLLYCLLTKEAILVTGIDMHDPVWFANLPVDEKRLLYQRWFLRPHDSNDFELINQVRDIALQIRKNDNSVTTFTIFPTTSCNARCFYCFEEGISLMTMSDRIAKDVARYIVEKCNNHEVVLRWFGGEPLLNTRAIDLITTHLCEEGVRFSSMMTTNGYLIDCTTVDKAVRQWHLDEAQITLDGCEAEYNRRKAFVHPSANPYYRVMGNIRLLVDAGVHVVIRLNMDEDNFDDLYSLAEQLSIEYSGNGYVRVYPAILYEKAGVNSITRSESQRERLWEMELALRLHLKDLGLGSNDDISHTIQLSRCIADSQSSVVITPHGALGCCEHYADKELWGSIYSDARDDEVLTSWRKRMPAERRCETCLIYPECIRLVNCPGLLDHCTRYDQERKMEKVSRQMERIMREWRSAQA